MAIKLSGETIIDDSRVVVNADKIGIGQTTPRFDLEIHSNQYGTDIPTGIAVSATSNQGDDVNKAISVFNNTDDTTFSVSYRGRVDALEYYGVFKGSIDTGVAAEKANKIKVQTNSANAGQYLTFVDSTSDYEDLYVHTGIKYNPNFYGNDGSSKLTIDGDVGIAGTLTYEDVTNVDSLGIVTARKGLRVTESGGLHIEVGVSTFQGDVKITATGELDVPTGIVTAGKGLRVTSGGFTVTGVSTLGGNLIPNSNDAYDIGQDTGTAGNKRWNAIYAKEFRGGTFYGTIDGGVDLVADTVKTIKRSTNASHYLTFVDSNNDAATAESMYTDGDITYNPSTNQLVVTKIKPAKIIDSGNGSGSEDNVIKVDASGNLVWGDIDAGSVGTLNFTDLSDTPSNYTSAAGKLIAVKADLTGTQKIEFVDASSPGKTYDLTVQQSGSPASDANPILRLSDGTDNDDITITGGAGIDVNRTSNTGLEISSSGVADLKLVQHSNHTPSPKPERTCSNPIQVAIANGVATIGIGSTSNAYGTRFVSDTAPSGIDLCEGDIWYDLTGSGSSASVGSTKVAVLRDEKSTGTYGGKPGSGDYTGKRAFYNGTNYDSAAWFPRVLNTKYDPSNIVTSFGNGVESGNQYSNTFSLAQGKYRISWRAPGIHCDRFQTRLAYNTNSDFSGTTSYYYGTSQYSGGDPTTPPGGNYSDSVDESVGEYIADISATTYFRIEQWIYTTKVWPGSGPDYTDATLGSAVNRVSNTNAIISPAASPTEVYTQVKIEDLASATKDVDVVVNAGTTKIAVLRDRKNQNIGGGWTDKVGTGGNASWNDRDLTVKDDPFNFVTFYPTINGQTTASRGKTPGYFSLPAGTYKIRFKAGGMRVGEHVAALVWSKNSGDISSAYDYSSNPASSFDGGYVYGTTPTAFGNLESGANPTYNLSYSTGSTVVTISETHFFKLIHYNDSNPGYSWAWGSPINTGASVDENNYALVEIEDLKTAVLEAGSGGSSFVLLPEKTATGNEVEFTGIPSDAIEITVMLKGVSRNFNLGTQHFVVQLGNSSGYINSGYVSNSATVDSGSGVHGHATEPFTNGFGIYVGGEVELHGSMIINKASSNSYTEIGDFRRYDSGGSVSRGSLSSVSGTIDRLKIKVTGSNTFDAGTISVSYKTSGTVSGGSGSSSSGGGSLIKLGTVTTTSGTEAPFTNIPSTAKKITVSVHRFSYSGTSDDDILMEVGDSTGYIQSGYQSNYDNRDTSPNAQSSTTFYGLCDSTSNARQYNINIELVNTSGNNWSISHTGGADGTGGNEQISYGGGSVSLSNVLNKLRIRTVNNRTFDNGEISVYYETEEGTATTNKIEQGDTKAEVIDTGTDGRFIVTTEGKEKFSVNGATNNVFIGAHTSDNPFTYLRFAGSQYGAADIRPVDELSHKIGLSFYTDNTQDTTINPAERLRITHNGIVNIGRALTNDPISATGDVTAGIKLLGATSSSTPGDGFAFSANAKTTVGIFNRTQSTGRILEFKYNGSVVGRVETDGTNTSYIESSDYRLKENIVGISDGITRLKTLKPYRFNFKSYPERTVDGFLAHEVTTAVPEAISGTKDQVDSDNNPVYQGIDKSKLVPLLVSALQEAVARIETLETEVAALKG